MSKTSIEWTNKPGYTGRSWNPIRGCSLASTECERCYAQTMAYRFSGEGLAFHGFAHLVNDKPRWTNLVATLPEKLNEPYGWKKPAMVFVNSTSDVFHKDVPLDFIKRMFEVMNKTPQHIYQILTKRADRLAEIAASGAVVWSENIWQGVSAGAQEFADERIPKLLTVHAVRLFVSAEPLLGPIDFSPFVDRARNKRIVNWILAGAESGFGARPMDEDWVRGIRDTCVSAKVAFFYKQRLNEQGHKVSLPELDGKQWVEWPE